MQETNRLNPNQPQINLAAGPIKKKLFATQTSIPHQKQVLKSKQHLVTSRLIRI